MPTLFLTPSGAYDRPAIMRAAWRTARARVVTLAKAPGRWRVITTARAQFAEALKAAWSRAKHERSYAEWCIEQDADAVRRAALPPRERQIEDARLALIIAEHADRFTAANNAAVDEARAHLAALQMAA